MNLIVCALLLAAAPATDDARFDVFAQKYVQELLDRDPETATRLGDHRNDARLDIAWLQAECLVQLAPSLIELPRCQMCPGALEAARQAAL